MLWRHGSYTAIFRLGGKQKWWCTGETDKARARTKATEHFKDAFKELPKVVKLPSSSLGALIAWYIDAPIDVRERTKRENLACLRKIMEACELTEMDSCDAMTPYLVKRWQLTIFNRNTANSMLTQARSVCAHDAPAKPPGLLVKPLKADRAPYQWPGEDQLTPLMEAAAGWRQEDPPVYSAWLMASNLGLRAGEIAASRRTWINGDLFNVRPEEDFSPKGRWGRVIPLPADVKRELLAVAGPVYLLPRETIGGRRAVIGRLNRKMKASGWNRRMGCHELRKLFGAQVATQCGIFAAQRLLGHKNVEVTNRTYSALVQMPQYELIG